MKEFGNTLAQLFFIIMIMIALAVSTATLSQWAGTDSSAESGGDNSRTAQNAPAAHSLSAPVAH
jgi:ABC-type cobalt transport system substrate-binding protein